MVLQCLAKRLLFLCTICYWLIPFDSFSEGTKEVCPTSSTYGALSIDATYTQFATYNATANFRLYINISNYNETILFGLHRSGGNNRNYQLKDPSGTVVKTGLCPNTVADSGYISNYGQAVVGPFFTSGGYHPLKYQVLTGSPLGDYYIEFSGSIDFDLFDFQVVTGANPIAIPSDAIYGRVFSKSWQFYANLGPFEPFSGNFYVYSDDQITTSCNYNGAHVGRFTMFCNQYGCLNTGNFSSDRQSKNNNTSTSFPGIAQYKVFLNNPDPLIYADGVYGAMIGAPTYPYMDNDPNFPICSGRKIIYVDVNKEGNVDILVTFPYGSPGTDVHLYSIVVPGVNEILWNGLDGTGTIVPDGTLVTLQITYVNGLTNLPLWDIERNPNGFTISLIRPINPGGENPKTYWDDSQLNGCPNPKTTNLTGCLPATTGCHIWEPNGPDCHDKMINTWWYSASSSKASITSNQIVTPPPPVINGNFDRCGAGIVNLIALVLNGEVVRWYTQATGGTPIGESNSGAPFAQTLSAVGTYTFYAEAYNPTPPYFCTSATRTPIDVHAIVIPSPPTELNPPFYNCGPGSVVMNVQSLSNIRVDWYDAATGGNLLGTGNSFSTPSISVTTTFYAEAVNTTYPTLCNSTSRTPIVAEIREIPVFNTAPITPVCSGTQLAIALGSTPSGSDFTWSAISNPAGAIIQFTNNQATPTNSITDAPVNTISNDASVIYTIIPHLNGCNGSSADYSVTVYPVPHLTNNPPLSRTICSGATAGINLVSDVSGTTFTWTNAVTIPPVTINNPSVQPGILINDQLSNSGTADAEITYTITPSANHCDGPHQDYTVTVHPVPHLTNAVMTKTICSGVNAAINLDYDVTNTSFSWTSVVTSGAVNITNPSTQPGLLIDDNLANPGIIIGVITYSITPQANNCNGPIRDYSVSVNPVPVANSISNQIICSGVNTAIVPLFSNVTALPVDYTWTVTCETGIPVCPPTGTATGPNPAIPQVAISNTDLVSHLATYTVTPSIANCTGTSTSYNVQVNPSPTVTNSPLSQQICSGTSSTEVVLTANVSPTTFTWTATASSGTVSNFQTSGTATIPIQTITNSSSAQGFVNYHIIPSSQSGMACPGAAADYKIYVNPLPSPLISGPQQVCYNQSGSIYSTPAVANHDYIWTVTSAISFTGNHTNTINIDWGPGPSGTVQLTEIDQNFTTNCSTTTPVYNVIINPAPSPVITGPSSPCGQTTQVFTVGSAQANHTYLWTVTGGAPVTGTNPAITVTWGNTNPVSIDIVESITYAPGVVCTAHAPAFPVNLVLIPDAAGAITGPATSCLTLTKTYTVGPISTYDSYTWWYNPGTGVTLVHNGASADLTFGLTAGSGSLFVQGNKTGCASGPVSPAYAITLYPQPYVDLRTCNDIKTTSTARPFSLRGGVPSGGKYYIDATLSAAGIFNPAVLSTTVHNITYVYTDFRGCINTSIPVTITISTGSSLLSCPSTFTDVRDNKTYRAFNMGTRCWMLDNLTYGASLTPTDVPQRDNCTPEKYCLSTDPTCTVYGGLYQWDEIMQYQVPGPGQYVQGLCPPEWHVPTSAEWQLLIDGQVNSGNGIAGSDLKDPVPTHGFRGLLDGIYYQNTLWDFTTGTLTATMFWTSTDSGNTRAVARGLNSYNPSVSKYFSGRSNAFPVRCVKD